MVQHNLERTVDRFFGRDVDLAAIDDRIRSAPLVTIVGPPGVGKTRIARELALRESSRGAWFVSLADARDEASAANAILVALGSREVVTDPAAAVLTALRSKNSALLVLDKLEHLDLRRLLRAIVCDAERVVTVLCTSRRVLEAEGEVVWTLGPLHENADAVALLLDRVRRIFPTYEPVGEEQAAIEALVDRLDRLPLAIELLAPQLRMLSAVKVLEQRRWDIGGNALRQSLESSLADLDSDARVAFEEATVFRGGFTLDAAEHVLGAGKEAARAVKTLLDRSLLSAAGPGMRRFRMLEVVRELAPLSAEPVDAKRRHAGYYLRHCGALAGAMHIGTRGAREELEAEIENSSAVHGRAVRDGDANTALRIAEILEDVTPFPMRRSLIDAAIGMPNADPVLRARAHLARAALRRMQADWSGSITDAETARAIGEEIGAADIEGRAWVDLGAIAKHQGNYPAARERYGRGLERLRSVGDRRGEAEALGFFANCLLEEGQIEEARATALTALEIARLANDEVHEGHAHSRLANILFAQGARAEAAVHYEHALRIMRAIGPRWAAAGTLMNYALLAQEEGDFEQATSTLDEALRMFAEEHSGSRHEVLARVQFAWLHVERGDAEKALAELARARPMLPAEPRNRALFFAALACAEAMRDRHDAAREAIESARAAATVGAVRDAVHVAEGIVESLRAVHERAHRNGTLAMELEARARERLESAGKKNDDVRLAARILARMLAREGTPIVFATGSAFVTSSGERVELESHPLLARLVRELAAARTTGISTDELMKRAWPDERMTHASAQNRLRVALSRLRRMGLPLVARDGGYFLPTDVQIVKQ